MSRELEIFVHSALESMGAHPEEIASGVGVWRAQLPGSAARFLGRPADEILLYTFDLTRWEEGAKLECLSACSPLVERLGQYALARGAVASMHLPTSKANAVYRPYLVARFAARFSGMQVREESRWLGIDIDAGEPIRVKGDPLSNPTLVEGAPRDTDAPAPDTLGAVLETLTSRWNDEVAQAAQKLQEQIERRYRWEAAAIIATGGRQAQEDALLRLRDRMVLQVECRLVMALVLWMPLA